MTILESPLRPDEETVVTKAVVRAVERLGLTARTAAATIGVSEATFSRLRNGGAMLETGTKPFELALLVIRLFRSLDAIVGGDEAVARAWIRSDNTALGAPPLDRIATVTGLVDVVAYLDARRALI